MNIGAPIIAVITPIGISTGGNIVRDKVSHTTMNAAPAKQEAGIKILWFGPTIILVI